MSTISDFFANFSLKINNLDLYQEAFTHNSFSNERHLRKNYERLEFFGDSILEFKTSVFLFHKYKEFNNEGKLTKMRQSLVCEDSLSYVAKKVNLGKLIRLGVGEINSRGFEKKSILADVFESVLAAIYLDLGDSAVDTWLNQVLFVDDIIQQIEGTIHDYKTELQELVQLDRRNELKYVVIEQKRLDDNSNIFKVEAIIDNVKFGHGTGNSKKIAEQNAAKDALTKLYNKS